MRLARSRAAGNGGSEQFGGRLRAAAAKGSADAQRGAAWHTQTWQRLTRVTHATAGESAVCARGQTTLSGPQHARHDVRIDFRPTGQTVTIARQSDTTIPPRRSRRVTVTRRALPALSRTAMRPGHSEMDREYPSVTLRLRRNDMTQGPEQLHFCGNATIVFTLGHHKATPRSLAENSLTVRLLHPPAVPTGAAAHTTLWPDRRLAGALPPRSQTTLKAPARESDIYKPFQASPRSRNLTEQNAPDLFCSTSDTTNVRIR